MILSQLEETDDLRHEDMMTMLCNTELTAEQKAAIADKRVRRGAERFDEYFEHVEVESIEWRSKILDAIRSLKLDMASSNSCVAGIVFASPDTDLEVHSHYTVGIMELQLGGKATYFGFEADWMCDYIDLYRAWARYLRGCNRNRIDALEAKIHAIREERIDPMQDEVDALEEYDAALAREARESDD